MRLGIFPHLATHSRTMGMYENGYGIPRANTVRIQDLIPTFSASSLTTRAYMCFLCRRRRANALPPQMLYRQPSSGLAKVHQQRLRHDPRFEVVGTHLSRTLLYTNHSGQWSVIELLSRGTSSCLLALLREQSYRGCGDTLSFQRLPHDDPYRGEAVHIPSAYPKLGQQGDDLRERRSDEARSTAEWPAFNLCARGHNEGRAEPSGGHHPR